MRNRKVGSWVDDRPVVVFKDKDFVKSGWCGNRPRCVAVAIKAGGVGVRDTKDKAKNTLMFTRDEWDAFVKGVKAGQFDV